MKSLFNKEDTVTLIQDYPPNCMETDYFQVQDLKEIATTLGLSTISTNNLILNQDENQLQRTKIDFERNENQRGIICLYPENRPRVTICSLGYTAVGYRSGIEISRCKN